MAELKSLGRYTLERVLGNGAMGVVYEGFDPRLNRKVAIKTILKGHLDEATAKDYSMRFVREAQAVARLNHPNIVQVHDFGEEGDIAYIVMEFIRGKELKTFFDANERFDLKEVVRIMGELCNALDFAHQAGVVHRDVKPGNVMLDLQTRAKLTDFGVARVQDVGGTHTTQGGTMVGTPAYMSPEQITGGTIDRRTDVFSAGIVLYQFLTGDMPFTGGGAWTIAKKIMQDEPALPSSINTSVSPLFDAVVSKALAKDPGQRYQSAHALGIALKRALEGKPEEDETDKTVVRMAAPALKPAAPSAKAPVATPSGIQDAEVEFWRSIKDGSDAHDFELYVEQFPNGIYAKLARHKISKLRGLDTGTRPPEADEPAKAAKVEATPSPEEEAAREAEAKARTEAESEARRNAEASARRETELTKRGATVPAKKRSAPAVSLIIGAVIAAAGGGVWFAMNPGTTPPASKPAETSAQAPAAQPAEPSPPGQNVAGEKAVAQEAASEQAATEKLAAGKAAAEKAAQDTAAAAKAAATKLAAEAAAARRAALEQKAAERAAVNKDPAAKVGTDKVAAERAPTPAIASARPAVTSTTPGQASQRLPDSLPRTAIAIADFSGEAQLIPGLVALLRADLERSGLFRAVDVAPRGLSLTEASAVDYDEWRGRSADALVMGSVEERPDGRLEVRFRLFDITKRMNRGGLAYTLNKNQLRLTAHRMADFVQEKLLGDKGVFSTRIAYVMKRGARYELQISDADGAGPQTVLTSFEAIASPMFSGDGKYLVYVSYEHSMSAGQSHPAVYTHYLADGKRRVVLNLNPDPKVIGFTSMTVAWAPDQRTVAVMANRHDGTRLISVTPEGAYNIVATSGSTDSSPAFSPDGQWIYFTSNRTGSRQIHRIPAGGGEVERISKGTAENFSPMLSADGKTLAYITREHGNNRLAAMDLVSGRVSILAESPLDERISFSPNGQYVIFVSQADGQRVVQVASVNRRDTRNWTMKVANDTLGDVAWGPLLP